MGSSIVEIANAMNEQPQVAPQTSSRRERVAPQVLSHFGQRLVELAEVAPGAHVLDVAVGGGAILFPAAGRVGPSGLVIGIDRDADNVRGTAAEIKRARLGHVEVKEMNAQDLLLREETFDWVLCGFALSSFPRPHRALQEFVRVLRRGGCVAISAWSEDCPFLNWWREVVRPYAPDRSSEADGSRFDTPARLETALREAGFENIRTSFEDSEFVYADEEEWWTAIESSESQHLPALVMERIKNEMIAKVSFLKQPDGIHNPYRALFSLGIKPVE
jgi:ubiquinone/menaquinone biosynthesis C-methylase UbiE